MCILCHYVKRILPVNSKSNQHVIGRGETERLHELKKEEIIILENNFENIIPQLP